MKTFTIKKGLLLAALCYNTIFTMEKNPNYLPVTVYKDNETQKYKIYLNKQSTITILSSAHLSPSTNFNYDLLLCRAQITTPISENKSKTWTCLIDPQYTEKDYIARMIDMKNKEKTSDPLLGMWDYNIQALSGESPNSGNFAQESIDMEIQQ